MARTRYRIFENEREYPYFMTCTVVGWLPVFTRPQTVDIVLNSWRHLREHNQFQRSCPFYAQHAAAASG